MMADKVRLDSRLRFFPFEEVDGFEFWGAPQYPKIPIQKTDRYHTVQEEQRLDIISKIYYGTVDHQWIIAEANDLELWPSDVNVGQVLRIPNPRWVQEVLFSKTVF